MPLLPFVISYRVVRRGVMKKNMRKIASVLLMLCLVCGMFALSSGQAYAEGESWELNMNDYVWAGDSSWVWLYDVNSEIYVEATVLGITSSDPAVLAIEESKWWDDEDNMYTDYYVRGKKAGTADISVDYSDSNGKTGTLTKTITVKKYPYAIKSLKLNGKSVKISKNKFKTAKKISKSKTSVNIKMALKKGWKIVHVHAFRITKSGTASAAKITKKMVTRGSSIKLPKKYTELWVEVELKKGSDYFYYDIDFHR